MSKLDPKTRKTVNVIGFFLALVLLAVLVHACAGPAQAQLAGRNPNPDHWFSVTVVDESGSRIGGGSLAALPPIGYRWQGREVVGGSIDAAFRDSPQTSTNIARATVVVR